MGYKWYKMIRVGWWWWWWDKAVLDQRPSIWMMERPSINRQLGWGYPQLYSSCFSWINWIETTKHDVSNGGISTKTKVLVQILVEWTSCFSWTKVSNGGISTKHECVFGWIWPSDSCVFLNFLFCGRWLPLGQKKISGEHIGSNIKKWACHS
jgi:hypothetical protein